MSPSLSAAKRLSSAEPTNYANALRARFTASRFQTIPIPTTTAPTTFPECADATVFQTDQRLFR